MILLAYCIFKSLYSLDIERERDTMGRPRPTEETMRERKSGKLLSEHVRNVLPNR